MNNLRFIILLGIHLLVPSELFADNGQGELYVFAAASLTDAMTEIAQEFEASSESKVYLNVAGSNTLRTQIERGVPCDIFISADLHNVRQLVKKDMIDTEDQEDLLRNSLVVISHKNNPVQLSNMEEIIAHTFDYLSLADPDTVPAGIYAKEALMNAGLWPSVSQRIAPALDVRAALVQVEGGNAQLGIVYQADVKISPDVRVAYEIPAELHSEIRYPVCLIKDSPNRMLAQEFFMFLQNERIKKIFKKHGFKTI